MAKQLKVIWDTDLGLLIECPICDEVMWAYEIKASNGSLRVSFVCPECNERVSSKWTLVSILDE